MIAQAYYSCRLCRTTYVANATPCPACTHADTLALSLHVRHLLGLRRNVNEARARLHDRQLATAGAA